ncbi:MAG: hypothetical protein GTO24_25565 [candidate division Zixibacteria bacterium]|nr:hypothetical protein [candidate division Zixibacteria bacterium]
MAKSLPRHEKTIRNLARYILRASFSQERMTYIHEEARIVYQSKDGNTRSLLMLSNGWIGCYVLSSVQRGRADGKVLWIQ